jgi:hypothetical protein
MVNPFVNSFIPGLAKINKERSELECVTLNDGTELDVEDEEMFDLLVPESPIILHFKYEDLDQSQRDSFPSYDDISLPSYAEPG